MEILMKNLSRYGYAHQFNPLNPNSDRHQISPCNINAYSTPEVMRIKNVITQGECSEYFINFSPVLL